jgi:hypothetical protein
MIKLSATAIGTIGVVLSTACSHLPFRSPSRPPPPTQVPAVEPTATPTPPPPPASFVATTSDVRATRIIDVREGLTKMNAFRAATELLTTRYTVDVSDQRAGFLMTPWQAGSTSQGAPDLRYRTRIIIRFLGEEWKQVSVRAEANWQRGDEWDIGFDAKILEDVSTELKNRVGKK